MPEKDMQETYVRWIRQAASRPKDNKELRERAWKIAHQAAQILKERYGVSRVRVFGSLAKESGFLQGSDIDLAVEGLKLEDYWSAVSSVLYLDNQIPVEIVDKSECHPHIWTAVEKEGIDL
jgi:predicted nucleotidyltransferase